MRIFQPSTAAELADWLVETRDEAGEGAIVTGAEPDWRRSGIEPLPGKAVSTANIADVIEFRPADLTIKVGVGMRVAELGRFVWNEGLWLPFADDVENRSIGGLVAEAPPSPFDASFGPVRRHVLACNMVLYDGRLTRWGRAVMKNVAGYDVPRLACGSRGRLGVLTSVTLRLWPRPRHLRRFSIRGSMPDHIDTLSTIPRLEGLVTRRRPGAEDVELEAILAGGDASTDRRQQELERWAGSEKLAFQKLDAPPTADEGSATQRPPRPRDGGVYRVTFGRRYLSVGLEGLERSLGAVAGGCRVESFPATGVVRVELDGLEPVGRRTAPAWLTTIAELLTAAPRTSLPAPGPALRIERGGPAEHAAGRRLRPAATRHLEGRLLGAFGGRDEVWQADYL